MICGRVPPGVARAGVFGRRGIVLGLGIGVNAIGFSIIDAAFLRELPFEESRNLYVVTWQHPGGGESDVSYPEYQDWRDRLRSFAGLAAFRNGSVNIADDITAPREVRAARITANALAVLRTPPLLGRDFGTDDDRAGAAPVAIISASLWRSHYASDPGVIGRTLRVNGELSTIVGVMRDGMKFPNHADLWIPLIPALGAAQARARSRTNASSPCSDA